MKLTKVAFAIASVLAVAAGSANAGQIDSSSATLAIEVIKNNTQTVRAPSKTYSFAGDIDARTNEQRLQLQYKLSKGTWSLGGAITAANTLTTLNNGAAGTETLTVAYTNATNAGVSGLPANTLVQGFITADKSTLVINITVPAGANNLLKAPAFTINPFALGSGNVGLNGLADVAGLTACVAPDASLDINFKHFTNHNGNTDVLANASPDSEHLRAGSTNDARLLNFTQNLAFDFTPAAQTSRTNAATLNQSLLGSNWTEFDTTTGAGVSSGTAVDTGKTRHYLGKVNLKLRGNGLDTNFVNTYGNADAAAGFLAADFDTTAAQAGEIELGKYVVEFTLPSAWPAGTVIKFVGDSTAPVPAAGGTPATPGVAGADIPTYTKTLTAGQTVVTFEATSAANAALLAAGVHVFADFPGNALIPQTGAIATAASIVKLNPSTLPEQDNVCRGNLTGIGGGIKIDVRNYASYATYGDAGPMSLVRVINNSETTSADVYAQMIYADGTYGAWGKLGDLKPREVLSLRNKELEAKLINAAATTNPFGNSAVGYSTTGGSAVVKSPKADTGTGDRVRIVSNTGSTLRVQSYIVQGSNVLDTSGAQGVDFENTGDRVPTNGRDAQPVSQDAINGLGK
jgi:hypothetical protein